MINHIVDCQKIDTSMTPIFLFIYCQLKTWRSCRQVCRKCQVFGWCSGQWVVTTWHYPYITLTPIYHTKWTGPTSDRRGGQVEIQWCRPLIYHKWWNITRYIDAVLYGEADIYHTVWLKCILSTWASWYDWVSSHMLLAASYKRIFLTCTTMSLFQ